MPATRDKTQKVTFVYSNLYSIYRKGVEQARNSATGVVLKTASEPSASPSPAISPYSPAELIGKRVARPAAISAPSSAKPPAAPTQALDSLKQNLKQLNDLQSRLRFMLQELEELVKE